MNCTSQRPGIIHRELLVFASICALGGLLLVWTGSYAFGQNEQGREGISPQGAPPSADSDPVTKLPLSRFRPASRLRVPETKLDHARFPVVDIHTHFTVRLRDDPQALEQFVALMDRNQIAVCISLDGTLGNKLQRHRDYLGAKYLDRFAIFANIDFVGDGDISQPATWASNQHDFVRIICEQLRKSGAPQQQPICGLKFFKQFGLEYKNSDGSLTKIDDPRFDPVWQTCGELGIPVIMHVADPSAFFLPIDETNERVEELARRPEWAFPPDKFPTRDELHAARNRVIAKHPKTNFIAAHLGNDGEDLQQAQEWLNQYPNLYLEFASRISELGRQPYSARKFIIKNQDRILFGTDGPWPENRIRLYWRFLETEDEYFPYSEKEFPPQGFWQIYGVHLPDETLRKIYHENALRLIPHLKEKFQRAKSQLPPPPSHSSGTGSSPP